MDLNEKLRFLELELLEANRKIKELEAELGKKKEMPKGGNAHVRGDIWFYKQLNVFMSKVDTKVDKSGKEYKDWKKAMEFARSNEDIQAYAKKAGVQITQRNLERWYKLHNNKIALNIKKM